MAIKVMLLILAVLGSTYRNENRLTTIKELLAQSAVYTEADISEDELTTQSLTAEYDILQYAIQIDGAAVDEASGIPRTDDNYVTYFMAPISPGARTFVCTYEDVRITYIFYDASYSYIGGGTLQQDGVIELEAPQTAEYITISCNKACSTVSGKVSSPIFLIQENNENVFVVSKEDGANSSIKGVVNRIEEGSSAFILVLEGEYTETIKAWGKKIIIYGSSRENCMITCKTSSYHAPPLEIACGGVYNMTIRATGVSDLSTAGAYGVHVEDNSLYENELIFYNCDISSKSNSAIGMGMRGGCRVLIEKCSLEGLEYGLFCHDSAYVNYSGVQSLVVKDTNLGALTGNVAVRFDSQGVNGARINVTFINNVLINKNASSVNELLYTRNNGGSGNADNCWMGLKNYFLTSDSTGNNNEDMNYK